MDFNKTKFTKLESKKGIFLQAGFIVTLAIVLFAFEWKSSSSSNDDWDYSGYLVENFEEDVIVTRREEPAKTPEPKTTEFKQVDNDDEADEDFTPFDAGTKQNDNNDFVFPEPPEPEKDDVEVDNTPFVIVQEMPTFPGGFNEMQKFIASNIDYPKIAREMNVQGVVYLQFIVEKDGSISNVGILRGIGAGCDEEAVRVIESMPRWNPGKQLKKPVRVQFNLPVSFKLLD